MSDKNNARWVQKKTSVKYMTALGKVRDLREKREIVEYIKKVRELPELSDNSTRCMHCLEISCVCAKSIQQ